jgi:hypothetical protein
LVGVGRHRDVLRQCESGGWIKRGLGGGARRGDSALPWSRYPGVRQKWPEEVPLVAQEAFRRPKIGGGGAALVVVSGALGVDMGSGAIANANRRKVG